MFATLGLQRSSGIADIGVVAMLHGAADRIAERCVGAADATGRAVLHIRASRAVEHELRSRQRACSTLVPPRSSRRAGIGVVAVLHGAADGIAERRVVAADTVGRGLLNIHAVR